MRNEKIFSFIEFNIEKKLSLQFIEQNIYFTLSSAGIFADVYIIYYRFNTMQHSSITTTIIFRAASAPYTSKSEKLWHIDRLLI